MIDWIAIFSNAAQELISPTTAAYALAALGLAIHFGYTGPAQLRSGGLHGPRRLRLRDLDPLLRIPRVGGRARGRRRRWSSP